MDACISLYHSVMQLPKARQGQLAGGTDLQHTGGEAARKARTADLLQHALTQPVKQRLQAAKGSGVDTGARYRLSKRLRCKSFWGFPPSVMLILMLLMLDSVMLIP